MTRAALFLLVACGGPGELDQPAEPPLERVEPSTIRDMMKGSGHAKTAEAPSTLPEALQVEGEPDAEAAPAVAAPAQDEGADEAAPPGEAPAEADAPADGAP